MKIDNEIEGTRCIGGPPLLGDYELVCLTAAQALLGHRSETRRLRLGSARSSPGRSIAYDH